MINVLWLTVRHDQPVRSGSSSFNNTVVCGSTFVDTLTMNIFRLVAPVMIVGGLLVSPGGGQAPPTQAVPAIDAGLGPCALELTITAKDGKPAGAADVRVHIAHGFGGFHKLDLEAGTNSDGKVKFTGLPSRVRRPPLEFRASKDQLSGVAMYDPASECQARHDIALETVKPEEK